MAAVDVIHKAEEMVLEPSGSRCFPFHAFILTSLTIQRKDYTVRIIKGAWDS
jgi:hypothetical protein